MNKILLASHGYLAQGMKSSLEILMGTNDRVECLCAYIAVSYTHLTLPTIA